MHRRFENDRWYADFVATVSARALIMRSPIEGSFAQDGTSPHRRRERTRVVESCSARSRTTRMSVRGATL